MKLLIVEDEQATREGLKTIINWGELGITEIRTASNGQRGVMEAKRYCPDIVLTDIRMPVMDGIRMAEELVKLFPQCCIVFLSAYAEISYYREAMRLKVVSYVEKPVTPENLTVVMGQAVKERHSLMTLKTLREQENRKRMSGLARELLKGGSCRDTFHELDSSCEGKYLFDYPYVTAMVVQFGKGFGGKEPELWLPRGLEDMARAMHMQLMCTEMERKLTVLLWFGKKEKIPSASWRMIGERIAALLGNDHRYDITVGFTARGPERAAGSYQSAAGLLQKSFYERYGTLIIWEEGSRQGLRRYPAEKKNILTAIEEMGRHKMVSGEEELYQALLREKDSDPEYVRDLYTGFYFAMRRQEEQQQRGLSEDADNLETLGIQAGNLNLRELHEYYVYLTERVLAAREQVKKEQSTVLLIKGYIREKYQDPYLSLKEISDYVHLSNSHMCMLFKKETGITINQYLTDVRMEKAKRMLKDGRYNVAGVSEMVGYRDSSYFGKAFRKSFGLTPLEYKDQWLSGKGE